MENELEKVISKYFDGRLPLYFHPADAIANDQYIRWEYFQNKRDAVLISIGSNDGEVQVRVFTDAVKLEQFIKLVIY